ncbi:MAG: 30S ribosomal protein S12 methylthiotransferase RimO, partial [Planctomycetota bacterium]
GVSPRRHPAGRAAPPAVGFVSLGCAKNLVDSERMLGQIAESGAILTDEAAADTIVVNTCGFLGAAREEALEVLRGLAERKRRGALRRIVVAGCLVQRDGASLLHAIPEIDVLVGVHNRDDVARAVWPRARKPATDRYLGDYHPQPWSDQGRFRLTPRHYAYVRISEGCNQKCTFCTIPAIRGPMRSKTPADLVRECEELIADGAREIVLIGQDTTSYGADLQTPRASGRLPVSTALSARAHAPTGTVAADPHTLAGLLRTLDRACDGAPWLRLMYVYPSILTDDAIAAIAESPRVVKYIDIPLQHVNDRMLKAMGRRVTRRQQEHLLAKLRDRIPGVTIRTTFIVGFPGETEAEFAELERFVREFGFDAVGAFEYSLEPDTPAGRMKHQLDPTLKAERRARLMLAQQEVAFAAARARIGSTLDVLVDSPPPPRTRHAAPLPPGHSPGVARHSGQAPEVDAVCRLMSRRDRSTRAR